MQIYTPKTFNLSGLKGISAKNIEEHLKLYAAYVKHTNLVLEEINKLDSDDPNNAYIINELNRRLAFEFGGMCNHEYYFGSLDSGPQSLSETSALKKAIEKDFGSFDAWLNKFKNLATTRGIGWAMLSYDKHSGQLLNHWVDEQHLGHLVSTSPILCLDMWEHAYYLDYIPAEKKKYVDVFFDNINWKIIEQNFIEATI